MKAMVAVFKSIHGIRGPAAEIAPDEIRTHKKLLVPCIDCLNIRHLRGPLRCLSCWKPLDLDLGYDWALGTCV